MVLPKECRNILILVTVKSCNELHGTLRSAGMFMTSTARQTCTPLSSPPHTLTLSLLSHWTLAQSVCVCMLTVFSFTRPRRERFTCSCQVMAGSTQTLTKLLKSLNLSPRPVAGLWLVWTEFFASFLVLHQVFLTSCLTSTRRRWHAAKIKNWTFVIYP